MPVLQAGQSEHLAQDLLIQFKRLLPIEYGAEGKGIHGGEVELRKGDHLDGVDP
jgi:hypothetical protein